MSPENNEENDGNENAEDNHIDVGDGNNDEVRSSRLHRRQLKKRGIVNSIDTAVDIDSYNPFPILGNLETYENIFKVDNNKKNDVICTFQNFPPRGNVGQNNHANTITGRQGPQPKPQNTPSLCTAFELYFTPDIVKSIVLHTNTKVQNTLSKLPDNFVAQNSRHSYMKEVTVEEIYTFIGLYLYLGLYKLNTLSVVTLFSNDFGPPIFSATMSWNRIVLFSFMLSFPLMTKQREKTDGNIIALRL